VVEGFLALMLGANERPKRSNDREHYKRSHKDDLKPPRLRRLTDITKSRRYSTAVEKREAVEEYIRSLLDEKQHARDAAANALSLLPCINPRQLLGQVVLETPDSPATSWNQEGGLYEELWRTPVIGSEASEHSG